MGEYVPVFLFASAALPFTYAKTKYTKENGRRNYLWHVFWFPQLKQ
jgi:hypothetical protein